MSSSSKRAIGIAIGIVILVVAFMGANYVSGLKEAPPKQKKVQAVREVIVRSVQPGESDAEIALQGRLVSFNQLPIIAEVTGVFESSEHSFKQGVFYQKGDILARINSSEAYYELLAQKSNLANSLAQAMPELKLDYSSTFPAWDAYLRNFDPEKNLPPLPPVADDAAKFFLNAKNIYSQYYTIKQAEERMTKYVLRAPFSGTLTEATATVGSLIRASQPLGTLTASTYELAATVPVADLTYLKRGTPATLVGPNGEQYQGSVNRISTQIDPTTQSATVFLDVKGGELREGLYLKGAARGAKISDVVAVDQRYLVGSNEVYVVRDSILERATVEVVRRGDAKVFVRGLAPGTQVLNETIPGAYSGMKVKTKQASPLVESEAVNADVPATKPAG